MLDKIRPSVYYVRLILGGYHFLMTSRSLCSNKELRVTSRQSN